MSVSIKVAVRCRPFTIDDDLGVNLAQSGEEEGEVGNSAPKIWDQSLDTRAVFVVGGERCRLAG